MIIGLVNTVLTTTALAVLHFPYLWGFAILIFILGLVPVFGLVVSLVPLILTAFVTGDEKTVLAICVWILFIHLFEAYVLHPRLMSQRTHMPILVILVNLIVMEHFIGPWGLIIGLPLLTFALDFFDIQKFK